MNKQFKLVIWFCGTLLSLSPVAAQIGQETENECSGECINIRDCPSLLEILQVANSNDEPASKNAKQILRKAVCAIEKTTFLLCCPRAAIIPSSSKCGVSFQGDKIVNGEDAALAAWPWMVIFRAKRLVGSGIGFWICGGVLITEHFVLTAAHCFPDTIKIEYARLGEFDLSNNGQDTGDDLIAPLPQDIIVNAEDVTLHPMYDGPQCRRCNDVALVKLARPAHLDGLFVMPICLPSNPERDMGFSASQFQLKTGVATGWGVTDAADIFTTRGATILQQVYLKIQEGSFCSQRKKNLPNNSILCAGQGDGGDVCRADSGGPLMLSDTKNEKWFVVGITSFGSTICGASDAQAVFTSVHNYIDWINKIIK